AQQLAASGVNVLTFDLRNFCESEGEPAEKLTPQEAQAAAQKWPADVDAAFEYLVSQPGVKRDTIGVGGASCGLNNSVQAARRHPEVKSLVLLAGSTNFDGRNFLRDSNLPVLYGFADDDEYPSILLTTEWIYTLSTNTLINIVQYIVCGHCTDKLRVKPGL